MNESHSPQVTGRSARPKGVRCTVWNGNSLSKPKPCPRWPISTGPPSCSIHPALGGWTPGPRGRTGQIGGVERVPREDVLDVHEQQLLMLLLVVEPQGDQLRQPGLAGIAEQTLHGLVDVGAIARDLVDARTRQEAALGSRMARPHRLVVRVEDVGVRIVEGAVAGRVLAEDEGLEEPGHVGPVPLRRAHVGHGLDGLVLGAQDGGQPLGGGPNPAVGAREVGRQFPTGHLHKIRPFAIPPDALAHAGSTVRFTLPRLRPRSAPFVTLFSERKETRVTWARPRFWASLRLLRARPGEAPTRAVDRPGSASAWPDPELPAGGSGGSRRSIRRAPCCGSCAGPGPRR